MPYMDLLDTSRDWLQLAGCIAGMYFIPPLVTEAFKDTKIPQIAFIAVASYVAWVTVYDYDLIFGFLFGAFFAASAELMRRKRHHGKTNDNEKTANSEILLNFSVAAIMLVKVVLFISV